MCNFVHIFFCLTLLHYIFPFSEPFKFLTPVTYFALIIHTNLVTGSMNNYSYSLLLLIIINKHIIETCTCTALHTAHSILVIKVSVINTAQ